MSTTDPFADAARAEAERRHVPLDRPTAITEQCAVQGFQDGAEWARTHLTAQEPNPVPDESEMEVVGDWLVVRNAQEPDYPAGPEYGPYPYSDAAPLIQLSRVAGYPPEPQEPTDAEVEAAARALHIAQLDGDPFAGDAWDEQPHHAPRKAWLRDLAHAALRGARTARRDEENR